MNYLILNVAGIGDFFELIRWLYLLKKKENFSKITLVVSDRVYEYARKCPFVDNVYYLRTRKNYVLDLTPNVLKLLFKLRKNYYDFVINTIAPSRFSGDLKMRMFLSLLRKGKTVGVKNKNYGLYFDIKIEGESKNNYLLYRDIFEKINILDEYVDLKRIIFYNKNLSLNYDILKTNRIKVLINPCGNNIANRIRPDLLVEFIEYLSKDDRYFIGICGGKKESEYIKIIYSGLRNKGNIEAIIQNSFDEWIGVIEKIDIVVSVDSATSHIASLFNKPSVIIYSQTDPQKTLPYNHSRVVVVNKKVICSPCDYYICPNKGKNSYICSKVITLDDIISAFKKGVEML